MKGDISLLTNEKKPYGILATASVVIALLTTGCGGGGIDTSSPTTVQPGVINLLITDKSSVQALVTENSLNSLVLPGCQFINQTGQSIMPSDPLVLAVVKAARNPGGPIAILDFEDPGSRNTPQYVGVMNRVSNTPTLQAYTCEVGDAAGGGSKSAISYTLTSSVSTDAGGNVFVTDTFTNPSSNPPPIIDGPTKVGGTGLEGAIAADIFNVNGFQGPSQDYANEMGGAIATVIQSP